MKTNFEEYISTVPGLKNNIANFLGISPDYLQKMFRGQFPWPEKTLEKLKSQLLKAKLDPDLFTFTRTIPPESGGDSPGIDETNPEMIPPESGGDSPGINYTPFEFIASKGWSTRTLAEKTGVSQGSILRVLRGRPCLPFTPDSDLILILAKTIGCKATDFNWLHEDQRTIAYGMDIARAQIERDNPTDEDIERMIEKLKPILTNPNLDPELLKKYGIKP